VLIDEFLPDYDVVEHHGIDVDAPVDKTYRAVKELDLARSPVVLALLFARGLPHLFTGAVKPKRQLRLDDIIQSGFVVLGEKPHRELVLGIVGKFWQLSSGVHRIEPDEFIEFDEPGYSKAVWNFLVTERAGGGSTVVTETRVACTDDDSRRKFSLYWWVIGRFSALIRHIVLEQIKRDAEAHAFGIT
jgi:hypothetical protein